MKDREIAADLLPPPPGSPPEELVKRILSDEPEQLAQITVRLEEGVLFLGVKHGEDGFSVGMNRKMVMGLINGLVKAVPFVKDGKRIITV